MEKEITSEEKKSSMEQVGKSENQSFWEHLDVLRASLVKIAIVTVAFGVVAFFSKMSCLLLY